MVHFEAIILLQQLVRLLYFSQSPQRGRLVVVAPVKMDLTSVGIQQAIEFLCLCHFLQNDFEIRELVELLSFLK